MKTLLFASVLLPFALIAQASPYGQSNVHEFACNGAPGSVQYSLKITTPVLAPRYPVSAITLERHVSYSLPGDPGRAINLDEIRQDDNTAIFGVDLPELPKLEVRYDKYEQIASIYRFGRVQATCSRLE